MFTKSLLLAVACMVLPASAAVTINFNQLDSTTLVITFPNAVEFTANTSGNTNAIAIVGVGTGEIFGGSGPSTATGTLKGTGPSINLTGTWYDGMPTLMTSHNIALTGPANFSFVSGDKVVLSAGSTFTLSSYALGTPSSGSYDVILLGSGFAEASGAGIAVPEISSAVLGSIGALALFRRRRA